MHDEPLTVEQRLDRIEKILSKFIVIASKHPVGAALLRKLDL